MKAVSLLRLWAGVLWVPLLFCQTNILPLREVRAGQQGVGRTVFQGERIDEFPVEILGVLENAGPKTSLILARLGGKEVERTGVMQGMSGSPVYIDGKLIGAVAVAFPFSKEPIAGIRPIEEMLRVNSLEPAPVQRAGLAITAKSLEGLFPSRQTGLLQGEKMQEIATPVSFSGFTAGTLDQFAPLLRRLGMEPRQGVSGGNSPNAMPSNRPLEPGAMISVQLLSGDMSVGADGTVTHVDGNTLYAFGHQFLAVGPSELPFSRASVLALLPNLSTSFKLSTAREPLGVITRDQQAAVVGALGRKADTIPLSIRIAGLGRQEQYRMQVVQDRLLTPFLLQMAVYSAIEATQRTLGTGSIALRGQATFADGTPPLRFDNLFASDYNVPLQASVSVTVPFAYALQGNAHSLHVKDISLEITAEPRKRQLQIEQVYASRRTVRPGEEVEITTVFVGENGTEDTRKVRYQVPIGAPLGSVNVTVADGVTSNLVEYQQTADLTPRTKTKLVEIANSLRPNNKAFVRVWRGNAGYPVPGGTLADPPPSLALILGRTQASLGNTTLARNAKLAEFALDMGDIYITGSRTIQLDIQE